MICLFLLPNCSMKVILPFVPEEADATIGSALTTLPRNLSSFAGDELLHHQSVPVRDVVVLENASIFQLLPFEEQSALGLGQGSLVPNCVLDLSCTK